MSSTVEFASKETADHYRDRYEEFLCPDDDARLKTVTFASDVPDHVLEEAERDAFQGKEERSTGPGQIPLSGHEKSQIDFGKGRANVPHARSVKAIAAEKGVDDWISYFDPSLTVDEHREILAAAKTEGGGRRHDPDVSGAEKAGEASRRAQAGECDHAEGHCKHGDQEACEFLKQRCGFSDNEVERILEADDVEELRDLPGEAYGALAKLWDQYRAGLADAKDAAAAINEVRQQHGQDPLKFEELGGRRITTSDVSK